MRWRSSNTDSGDSPVSTRATAFKNEGWRGSPTGAVSYRDDTRPNRVAGTLERAGTAASKWSRRGSTLDPSPTKTGINDGEPSRLQRRRGCPRRERWVYEYGREPETPRTPAARRASRNRPM